MVKHLIVTYSAEKAQSGHIDPNFTQLVYGNSNKNGNVLKKNVEVGSYIFFNSRIGNKRYITAYFYVEKILLKGEDDEEISALNCSAKEDEVIILGSRTFSKVLTIPLELDKELMQEIKSYNADSEYFNNKKANGIEELEAIKDKTLNPKVINQFEKELLLKKTKNRG
jgi:hypothetical protein